MRRYLFPIASMVVFLSVATGHAENGRYEPWNDPKAASASDMKALLGELDKLISQAEQDRAANPKFLQDLRALSGRFQPSSPKRLLLSDKFEDGDFTSGTAWSVLEGKYWIEKGWGLRSNVDATEATASNTQEDRKLRGEDVAIAVFGALLGATQGSQQQAAAQPTPSRATIMTRAPITNAFDLAVTMTSWKADGEIVFDIFQGDSQQAGYRVIYRSGQPMALQRFSRRGVVQLGASANAVQLEDKKAHQIVMTRQANGQIGLSVDGTAVIEALDQAFRDPFDGLAIQNKGGDYIVQSVMVWGL